MEELLHLSEQSDLAAEMIGMDMVGNSMEMLLREGAGLTNLLIKLLVNLTCLDDGVGALLQSDNDEQMYGVNVVKLVSLFNTPANDIKGEAFVYVGSILVNVSRSEAGRNFLLEPTRGLLKQILEFESDNPVHRKGVFGTVRNCCVGLKDEQLESLLGTSDLLWPTLLLDVAGTEMYTEEQTFKMPVKLGSSLLIERKLVDGPETRIEALESIYMIAMQERGRKALSLVNGELILQVGAACETNYKVKKEYERVSSLVRMKPLNGSKGCSC